MNTFKPRRVDKNQIKNIFEAGLKKSFQKKGRFLARFAGPGETILTFVAGRLETFAKAEWGDIILINLAINSFAERYRVKPDTFSKRYTITDETMLVDGHSWAVALAKGQINSFQYDGLPLIFEAPWGEDMVLNPGDWLANPIGGDSNDIYRIEEETFSQTYTEISDG